MTEAMKVKFWGVRGSIACSGTDYLHYGGNTPCVEVRCDDHVLIFDAGTGIRGLGQSLLKEYDQIKADLFLSHTHLDHIIGIPFFCPFHIQGHEFNLWAGHLEDKTIKQVICQMMSAPLFPIPTDFFKANVQFHDFKPFETLKVGQDIHVKTTALNHPNGAIGYRVDYKGKSVCYVTDTEHILNKPDENILKLIQDADIFIYDSTYTDEEYENHKGWGHSTWEEGVRLSNLANVKTFIIFHHDPNHPDSFMEIIAQKAHKERPGTLVSHEGMVLSL